MNSGRTERKPVLEAPKRVAISRDHRFTFEQLENTGSVLSKQDMMYVAPTPSSVLISFEGQTRIVDYVHPIGDEILYRNPKQVEAFLKQYPQIRSFLQTVLPELHKQFGRRQTIVLEVLTYPEEGCPSKLVGWIQVSTDVEKELKRFYKFEEEWLLEQTPDISDHFHFNLETNEL